MSASSIIIMIIFVICVVFQIVTLLWLVGATNRDTEELDDDLTSMDRAICITNADIAAMNSKVHELATNVQLLGLRAMKEDQGEWWPEDHYRLVVGDQPAIRGRSCVHIRQHMRKEGNHEG